MYKVGDTPKLIAGPDEMSFKLTKGRRYEILSFDKQVDQLVYIKNDVGIVDFWNIYRFQPYKEYQFEKEMSEIINE